MNEFAMLYDTARLVLYLLAIVWLLWIVWSAVKYTGTKRSAEYFDNQDKLSFFYRDIWLEALAPLVRYAVVVGLVYASLGFLVPSAPKFSLRENAPPMTIKAPDGPLKTFKRTLTDEERLIQQRLHQNSTGVEGKTKDIK